MILKKIEMMMKTVDCYSIKKSILKYLKHHQTAQYAQYRYLVFSEALGSALALTVVGTKLTLYI